MATRIHLETQIAAPIKKVFDLARDIDFHQRSMEYTGEQAIAGRSSGLIGPGETVTWRAKQFGFPVTMTSRVTEFEPPHRFVDEQAAGPFESFRHVHTFEPTPSGTLMIDDWEHVAPLRVLGRIADALVVRPRMRTLLERRIAALKREAEAREV